MRFRVLWTPIAESRLAEAWIAAPNRSAVAAAAAEIDRQLAARADSGAARVVAIRPRRASQLRIEWQGPMLTISRGRQEA